LRILLPEPWQRTLLFSPRQVQTATFLGGPPAGAFLLKKNFDALGRAKEGRWALGGGVALTILLMASAILLPELDASRRSSLNMLIVIVYSTAAYYLVEKLQMSKASIEESARFGFQPTGRVVLVTVVSLVVVVGIAALAIGGWYLLEPAAPGTRVIRVREIPGIVNKMETDASTPGLVVFRLSPPGASRSEDVLLAYERTDRGVVVVWCDWDARNKADMVAFRGLATRTGVELVEQRAGERTCLYGIGARVNSMGSLVARELYGLGEESELTMVEVKEGAQGSKP
jgi:hypothetical protein